MFLQFYGLREQPFGVTPDPRYVYAAPRYQQALASLLSVVENELGFCAMVAPPGLGKTTLLFQLLETLRATARTAFVFQTLCGPDDLLRHILLELDLRIGQADVPRLHIAFNDFLVAQARAGQRVVIVLDEAQNLPEASLEFVRLLTNFETPCRKLLTVVLSGQPQLADKISDASLVQLGQRIATAVHLTPFNQSEVAEYVRYRLRVAGHPTGNLFDEGALGEISVCTLGVPRMINHVCFNALLLGCALGLKKISSEIVCEAAARLDFRLKGAATASAASSVAMATSSLAGAVPAVAAVPPVPAPVQEFELQHRTAAFEECANSLAAPPPSGSEMAARPPQTSETQEPVLTLGMSDSRGETQRLFALTAAIMLIIVAACLIWFSAERSASHTASAAEEQSVRQQDQKSIANQSAQQTKHSRRRRAKPYTMEELGQLATQLTPMDVPVRPGVNSYKPPNVNMRVGSLTPILEAGTPSSSVVPAALRQGRGPLYPDAARKGGVGGRVIVEAIISKDGQVSEAHVVEGDPQLQDAAETAVRQWSFSPAQVDGQAVPSKATIEFYFHAGSAARNQVPEFSKRGSQ